MSELMGTGSVKPASTPSLRLVFWETTAACNLACIHCRRLETDTTPGPQDITTDQAQALIRSLGQIGRPILVFSGGEPLMRNDLFELTAEAKAQNLPMALATNGTMIDAGVAPKIADAGFQRVSISFDGPDAASHDAFRGIEGAFDSAVNGFRLLRSAGMSMQVNTTITRHNYARLDDLYRMALDLGAAALHLFMLVPVGCGMELDESVMLEPAEYEQALNWVYDRSLENKLQLKATCAPHYFRIMLQRNKHDKNISPGFGHPSSKPADILHTHSKGCLAGQAVCFVSHTGEVFPCGYLPVSCGNILDEPLPVIWRESSVFADLRGDARLTGKCGQCEYKQVCMGCRARAYAATHDYLAEEPNCGHQPMRRGG